MANNLSIEDRINLLCKLGVYMDSNELEWMDIQDRAVRANAWFTPGHIALAVENIVDHFLQRDKLEEWVSKYTLPATPKTVGIVMAGNIPLVGFHDLLCGFITGHIVWAKLSSKDDVLIKHLIAKLTSWDARVAEVLLVADRLNDCDAYIATGSNNTARYFEQYFGKYPHIIRKNRTSVAILDGTETEDELSLLADDVYMYYGLGCRNVTQIAVPRDFDFARLLNIFNRHNDYADLNKYKNNYDYHLAIYLLNRIPYMSNESLLMVENELPFSAVSVLHYKFYDDRETLIEQLGERDDIQAIIGHGFVPFGDSQKPSLGDYADGEDTMAFLCGL